ncbi:uncharacterized protein LOC122024883 isoform X2 [Zingiber officinale]|uniref:uncharacterized protein LOC122024883 isoform X2 n=1 Tax=Zingiber officinale TaxID=94328 RepID=UPI001C4DC75D|nr:uncharacterized protein LOC122024883 isoform X2 [Zingiber officinale]XP_042439540.1 uncharacterized protein LOC122024883 isoform X2 [Zingiber officinale]
MAASTTSFAVPSFHLRICTVCPWPPPRLPSPPSRYQTGRGAAGRLRRCCFQPEKAEWRFDPKRNAVGGARRSRTEAFPSLFFSPSRFKKLSKQDFSSHCCPKNSPPESRDTPPQRDTGIASEKEWGINLLDEKVSESGQNEYGSTWYRDSGEELGENGFRCHWAKMGGKSPDGKSVWQEMWWEKSDWTGYKELGAEKSGENDKGDSWWETWKEILYQDEWSNLARIERSAQKQAKSGIDDAGWYEKWWEKYDAKGWTEKGAHKYGRLNEQSWWEKWGEHYDGRGFVLKWTDKWAETQMGTRWGDKWGDKFFEGIGSRQGETWHVSPAGERKYTSMEKALQEKAGTSLWMKKPITRPCLIMDGQKLLVILPNCYQFNLVRSTQVYILMSNLMHQRKILLQMKPVTVTRFLSALF